MPSDRPLRSLAEPNLSRSGLSESRGETARGLPADLSAEATACACLPAALDLAQAGLPFPPPTLNWRISSDLKLVSFEDHHPTPRQFQNVGVQRAALAGVPHDPARPVLVLLERIAKGPDAARLQTDQGET